MEEKNYYQILNIDRNASVSDIKSAYLREARLYHPDHHAGKEEEFVKKFQDIMEAYKVLSDPKTKALYDRSLELKNHLIVVNPSILDSRFASLLDKNNFNSGDFSSLKREFSFSNPSSSRSAQYSNNSSNNPPVLDSNNSFSYSNNDDSKRVKLEHVFQFSRQGDSFTFHRQPIGETSLNSTTSSEYSRNSIPSHSVQGKSNSAPHNTLNNGNQYNNVDLHNKNIEGLNMLKSGEYQQPRPNNTNNSSSTTTLIPNSVIHSNNSTDYSKLKLPSFNLSSQEYKTVNNNSLSNLQHNLSSKYSNPLPSPSNLLNTNSIPTSQQNNPMLSSNGALSNSQIMHDNFVTLQTSISISFQESVYGCTKNILIKRQSICTLCNNSYNNGHNTLLNTNNSSNNINILNNQNSTGNINLSSLNDNHQKHNSSSHLPNFDPNQPFIFNSSNNSSSNLANSINNKEFIILPSLPNLTNPVNNIDNENNLITPQGICKNCNGKGIFTADARVAVNVPAGVINGSKQILRGEGEVSPSGKKGDLIVIFNVDSHPFLRRVGTRDVACDLPLSITQASLGSTLQIPSIYGTVQVIILFLSLLF